MNIKFYLEKFKKLPKELRDEVSSEESVRVLEEIEKRYNLALAKVVILVMIKEVKMDDLEGFLIKEFGIDEEKAKLVKKDLREKIFGGVRKYLESGISNQESGIRSQELGIMEERREREKEREEDLRIKKQEQALPMILDLEGDKEEITKLRKLYESTKGEKETLDKKAEEIIRRSGLRSENEEMERRFKNIILAQLKGIRKPIETKEVLMRAKEMGGTGMREEEAEKITRINMRIFANEFANINKENKLNEESEKKKEEIKKLKNLEVEEQKDEKVSLKDVTPALRSEESYLRVGATYPKPLVEKAGPKIEDIKVPRRPAKLIGPIEEIRGLRIEDWRKLADIPKQRANKIKEKIEILGKESLERKVQAIKAWKENEITQLYLEIGKESMEQRKSVAEVIIERSQMGKPTLNMEEFEVIADLNQSLRF